MVADALLFLTSAAKTVSDIVTWIKERDTRKVEMELAKTKLTAAESTLNKAHTKVKETKDEEMAKKIQKSKSLLDELTTNLKKLNKEYEELESGMAKMKELLTPKYDNFGGGNEVLGGMVFGKHTSEAVSKVQLETKAGDINEAATDVESVMKDIENIAGIH